MFRDLDTFDLRENRRLGPLLAVEVAAGLPALGADFAAYPIGATAGWSVAPGGSAFGLAQVQASARARSGDLIDQRLSAVLYFASPPIAGVARIVAAATTDAVRADTYRTRFFLGGDTGLRGYQIGEFQGTVAAAAHAEIRTAPLAVYSQRFGAILFYDVGHAAASYDALVPHHDFGVGLRWLIPQLNASVAADRLGDRDRRGALHPPRVARPYQRRLRAVVLAPGLPEGLPAAVLGWGAPVLLLQLRGGRADGLGGEAPDAPWRHARRA